MRLRAAGRICGMIGLLGLAWPATGQVSFAIGLTTDYRLRGYSMSRGEPAATASIGYDDASGLFADGTAIVFDAPDEGLRWMGGIVTAGYAQRIGDTLSFDIGVLRAQFSPDASTGRAAGYTEFFAGLSGRSLAAHVSISPDYFWSNTTTIYGGLDAVVRPAPKWRILGHVGALTYLGDGPPFPIARTQIDWRAGMARDIGRLALEVSLSGGGPDEDYYEGVPHSRTAVVGTLRFSF